MNKMTFFMDGEPVGGVTGVEARVCREIAMRQALGLSKYGKTLADNPALLIDRVQNLKEELLDASLYCQWIIDRLEAK